jgi:hypothetical protein
LTGEAAKQIEMAAYVLTDRAVIEALHGAAARGVKVRIWRDACMAAKVGDSDVEAQLGERVPGLEVRSGSPGGELMHLEGLLHRQSAFTDRLGQFQPLRRDAPGQRPCRACALLPFALVLRRSLSVRGGPP